MCSSTPLDSPPPTTIHRGSVQHVLNCSFSAWYSTFQRDAFPSRVIGPLTPEFIDYLLADGLFLPEDCLPSLPRPSSSVYSSGSSSLSDYTDDYGDDTEGTDNESDSERNSPASPPYFPLLSAAITTAIQELGGSVFPKLNWSSPKDATWIMVEGTTRCTSVADILLLLKSSDFIVHDLTQPFEHCEDEVSENILGLNSTEKCDISSDRVIPNAASGVVYELILRQWYDLHPSGEFRCIVRNGSLLAISQRDTANYYAFLSSSKEETLQLIEEFWETTVHGKFPDPSYVFDVYISQAKRVWLLDFNPYNECTDLGLFEWSELHTMVDRKENTHPIIRVVESQAQASSSLNPLYATNRLPKDVFDLSNASGIQEFVTQFQGKLQCQD